MTLSLANITIDCHDALVVGRFWSAALDRPLVEEPAPTQFFASIATSDGRPDGTPQWLFCKVPEGKTAKNRMHVDLLSDDREKEIARLIELGARRGADHDEWGHSWTVMADPEGNEFCVA